MMQLGGLRPQLINSFSLTIRMDLSLIEFIFAHTSDVKRVIGVMSIAINPLIMSDDHPAIMFVNFFHDKIIKERKLSKFCLYIPVLV